PIFDRMLYETNHGRFMYAPTAGLNHFGIHPTYVMVPLALLHRAFEGPLLLVLVTFVAIWAGVVPLWILVRRAWSEDAALLAAAGGPGARRVGRGRGAGGGGGIPHHPVADRRAGGRVPPGGFPPGRGVVLPVGWAGEAPADLDPGAGGVPGDQGGRRADHAGL